MGGSINGGTPIWLVCNGKSHLGMDDDWGYPHFGKPPYIIIVIHRVRPRMVKGSKWSFFCSHLGFKLMPLHGPPRGCGFCVTLGRTHFFATHPQRHPRFLQVASTRLRLLHTELVDLAEGFAPAFELPGQPRIADPPPPQGAGVQAGASAQVKGSPKGVKRREKNKAFREANYSSGWDHNRRGDRHSR